MWLVHLCLKWKVKLVIADTYNSASCFDTELNISFTKLLSYMTFSSFGMAKNTEQTLNPIISNLE